MPVYGDSIYITSPTEGQTYTASGQNSLATVVVVGNCNSNNTNGVSVTILHTAGPRSVSEAKTVQPNGVSWTAGGFTLMSGQNYTVSATTGNASDQKTITVV